jgi:uncharacterized protein (TIGR03032 family)
MTRRDETLARMWARHSAEWRDAAQICSQWDNAAALDPRVLEHRASRGWWRVLDDLGITLLVTREYENLVMAMSVANGRPVTTVFPLPHPSGLAVDRRKGTAWLASTRNPNQVYALRPAAGRLRRRDAAAVAPGGRPLVPRSSTFYPGSLYLHDLAVIGGDLHGSAAGHNAIVRLAPDGGFERVWWPTCVERRGRPVCDQNHIQLNSIGAGATLRDSYFSASSTSVDRLRPGHLNYPVDRRGVIFSGRTREPMCTGLTRPHSVRLHRGRVWVANSGYGEVGYVSGGRLEVVARLPGWTRGLCVMDDVVFVATSRVIPRYARYAPGLDVARSVCALHALSASTGRVLGSLEWPFGNQVFAIDWMPRAQTAGFPFAAGERRRARETALFYSFLFEKDDRSR